MLVLSRHKGEKIVIDPAKCPVNELGLIEIVLIEIRGDKCRVGVDAPKNMPVHRQEVYDAIHRQAAPVPMPHAPLAAFVSHG